MSANKSSSIMCFLAVFAIPAWGQTAAEIGARYRSVNAYEVRPGILMTAKYAEDGQVCEVMIEKEHQTPGKVDLGSTIPRELVNRLINEIVPLADRGKPTKQYLRNNAESTISGTVEVTESDFEKVSIEILGSVSPCASGDVTATIRWKRRACAASK
jgi:hypothetical protein